MKKTTKVLLTLGCAAAMATSAIGLTACGSAAETTGLYTSSNKMSWSNMLPTYNYFTLTYSTEQIETLSDGTYVLTVNTVTYSNVCVGPEVPNGEETGNDRGQTTTKYYGTYTAEEDEGDINLTLSAPTKAIYISSSTLPMDSTVTYGEDLVVANPGGGDGTSYNDYIAGVLAKFNGASVYVSGTSASFKYFELK
ncbi:MAG: hypothetical protein J6D37_01840 [Clostridia bacterium]|nr:hypothetical protein [Clostridia bacterium]